MLFTLFFLVCCLVLNLLVLAKVITTLHLFIFTQHGACVNAMDLWQFTPLHEAASKNRVEVCSLLLSYGADSTFLNCHNKSAIDLAPTAFLKERLACKRVTATKTNFSGSSLTDGVPLFVADEFRGHSLLLAAREADMARFKKHLSLETINFKHPLTQETALVRTAFSFFIICVISLLFNK